MNRRLFLLTTVATAVAADPLGQAIAQLDPNSPVHSGDAGFDAWAAGFYARAMAAGFSADLLRRQMTGLTPDDRVVAADHKQPEFTRGVGAYLASAVSDANVAAGRSRRAEQQSSLSRIQSRHGVPAEILIAIWAVESGFGQVQGDYDVVRSLATLAADGRRRDWAEQQLLAAFRIISSGEAPREKLRGSWAGAMGQTQFMPDTYLSTAVDIDGDGRRDIWASASDALGSAANLLRKAGWKTGEGWQEEVILPRGFDYSLAEGPKHPPSWWAALGVRRADGSASWPPADAAADWGLILPAGANGPAFLVAANHFVIRAYNNSTSYALAVGLLADRIAGGGPVVAQWPAEAPMSRADRLGAQQALNQLGYNVGVPDGIVGTQTRAAVRSWQKAKGLPADGYLTADLSHRLQAEAGLPATGN
jgi:membrane-bound lytic murein transglycosylase B